MIFLKCQLKVEEVIAAEKIKKTDNLLKLQIDVRGETVKTIVAGIASYYMSDSIMSMKVIVVANLRPVKLRGILSE